MSRMQTVPRLGPLLPEVLRESRQPLPRVHAEKELLQCSRHVSGGEEARWGGWGETLSQDRSQAGVAFIIHPCHVAGQVEPGKRLRDLRQTTCSRQQEGQRAQLVHVLNRLLPGERGRPGGCEIEQQHPAVPGEERIGRLDVPVHDTKGTAVLPERVVVGMVQRPEQRTHEAYQISGVASSSRRYIVGTSFGARSPRWTVSWAWGCPENRVPVHSPILECMV